MQNNELITKQELNILKKALRQRFSTAKYNSFQPAFEVLNRVLLKMFGNGFTGSRWPLSKSYQATYVLKDFDNLNGTINISYNELMSDNRTSIRMKNKQVAMSTYFQIEEIFKQMVGSEYYDFFNIGE